MKKLLILFLTVGFATALHAQPVLDGTFDGAAVWGSSVATNAESGWQGFDARNLYVTSDDDHIYFGATLENVGAWQSWRFVINTDETNGATTDPRFSQLTYGHIDSPNFLIRGGFPDNGEAVRLEEWFEGSWSGTDLDAEAYGVTTAFVEVRIAKADLGDPANIDVQFVITGNTDGEHSAFNSIPADNEMAGWNPPASTVTIENYATDVDFSPPGGGDPVVDAPNLSTPEDEGNNISSLASFTWEPVDHATDYRIRISTDPEFETTTIVTAVEGTSYTVPSGSGLRGSTTYYWEVTGFNAEGDGPTSATYAFETVPNFTVYFNNPDEWENVYAYVFDPGHYIGWSGELMDDPEAGSIWYSYDIPETFSTIIFNNNAGNQTDDLERNSTGWYDGTSDTWFDLGPISLNLPENNDTDRDVDLSLFWNADPEATTYHVQVSTDANFETTVIDENEIATSSFTPAENFAGGLEYYWRVRSEAGDSLGVWSNVWSFTTEVTSDAGQVNLALPTNNSTDVPISKVLIEWDIEPESVSYDIQMAIDEDFEQVLFSEDEMVDTFIFADGMFPFSTQLFWRVRGIDEDGNRGPWSETWNFTTVGPEATFFGNANAGFGNPIGASQIDVWDDGEDIFFEVTKGLEADLNDIFVIYLHTGNEGRAVIDGDVNDNATDFTRAVSAGGEFASDITFLPGFEASHAITLSANGGFLWRIPATGSIGDNDLISVLDFPAFESPQDPAAGFSFSKENLDLGEEDDFIFSFVGTYLNGENGFHSNEGYGLGLPGDNVGGDDMLFNSYLNYPDGDEIVGATANIVGERGWRLLGMPLRGVTLGELAEQNHMQGFQGLNDIYNIDGVDFDNATPNVLVEYENDAWLGIDFDEPTDLYDVEFPDGLGILWYFFDNDVAPSVSLPFDLVVTGHTRIGTESVTLDDPLTNEFSLLGNPFSTSITLEHVNATEVLEFDGLQRGGNALQASGFRLNPETQQFEVLEETDEIDVFEGFIVELGEESESVNVTIFEELVQPADAPMIKEVALHLSGKSETGVLTESMTKIKLSDLAVNGWDRYDLTQLTPLKNSFATISVIGDKNGKRVNKAIDSRPLEFNDAIEIPIAFDAVNFSGDFELSAAFDEMPDDWKVFITDHVTNETVNLREYVHSFSAESTMSMQSSADELSISTLSSSDKDGRFTVTIQRGETTSTPSTELPKELALSQNYPNPFNPTTVINFAVPTQDHVRLTVYDMLGRQVATLINESVSAGSHQVTFDATQLSSGMYIYRLETSGSVLSRSMTLIK